MLVDGIRMPDEFAFGPFLSARRDFVELDSLERAEITRGPISSLYGSSALGGVVAFTTKAPLDYILLESAWLANFKGGYSSANESAFKRLMLVSGSARFAGMGLANNRNGRETANQGIVSGYGSTKGSGRTKGL